MIINKLKSNIDPVVGQKITTILDSIRDLFLDKVERLRDEDEGVYWKIKSNIPGSDIDRAECLLNDVARLYRESGVLNVNPYYKKMSRMTAYIRMDYVPCTMDEILKELDDHLKKED